MAEFYKNTYPSFADNISAGYPLGSFWNNMVSYDVYEHVTDGEWQWRKKDGMLANAEIPEQLNKTTTVVDLDGIFNIAPRVIEITDTTIDLSAGEIFTKTLSGATTFNITNPINYKPFRIKLSGGSLNTPIFSGYTEKFIASTLRTDYVSSGSVLYCEIQSTNIINLFWGE